MRLVVLASCVVTSLLYLCDVILHDIGKVFAVIINMFYLSTKSCVATHACTTQHLRWMALWGKLILILGVKFRLLRIWAQIKVNCEIWVGNWVDWPYYNIWCNSEWFVCLLNFTFPLLVGYCLVCLVIDAWLFSGYVRVILFQPHWSFVSYSITVNDRVSASITGCRSRFLL